jgi:hypothetical protein
MANRPPNLPNTSKEAARQAREQAEAYESMLKNTPLEINGATFSIPPHPDLGMLDDDQMEEYEDLLVELKTYDREPDVPEQHIKDENGKDTGIVIPAQPGELIRPYTKDGVRVRPAYSIRVAKIALGETEYKRLREAGGSAADVWRVWGAQGLELRKRQAEDPKSAGSPLDLASVPAADSE